VVYPKHTRNILCIEIAFAHNPKPPQKLLVLFGYSKSSKMLFKAVLLAFALLSGTSARQSHGGLDLDGLLKFLVDDQAKNLRSPENRRRLQTVIGPNGETTTKEEIKTAILIAIGSQGGKGLYDDCVALFNAFDADGNGLLSATEAGKLIENILGVTEEYGLLIAEEFIVWYDADSTGSLNPEELEAACKGGKYIASHSMV